MNVLEAKKLSKVFPGVRALDSVDIAFEPGRVHCIVGENGAGKSTLIKCLTGVYAPDEGEIYINGKPVGKEKELFERVAYVPQETNLFSHLSVAENLFLPFKRSHITGFISQKELNKKAKPILDKYNITASPEASVKDISVSQQQLLQIARATVYEGYDVLMLDEPTTSLTNEDAERLFKIVEQLKAENKAIVFISHKLEEVFAIGDVITVFRNGKSVAKEKAGNVDIDWTVTQMTGRMIGKEEVFMSDKVSDEVLLEVEDLTGEQFRNINFDLKKGEILGFYGLVGAGRSELMQAIFGYLPVISGSVKYKGENWKLGDTSSSVAKGMFYLPEDRRSQGILADLCIRENISINMLDMLRTMGLISSAKEQKVAVKTMKEYEVKAPNADKEIKFLSGGNQQKVIIARAMACKPQVLIFDEPTKGIDVGTKTEIYKMMKRIAEEDGVGIILISSELNEVKKCSNRIISLHNGRKMGEHSGNADNEEIMSAIFGLKR